MRAKKNPLMLALLAVATLAAAAEETVKERAGDPMPPVAALIREAGQADSDEKCLAALKRLAVRPDLDARMKGDLSRLLVGVSNWTQSRSLYQVERPFRGDPMHDYVRGKDSPLYPLSCYYRGRILLWMVAEAGYMPRYVDEAVKALAVARDAFPDNRTIRMYLGEPIPWKKDLPGAEGAPEWACLQRESLERLADIITWWIDHRMQDDGRYGGGWGDDCEMWRWWVPVLLGFDDPKIVAAQTRFSSALMNLPHMRDGYTSKMSDVEHTAEDSADVITPMMHLAPDDAQWAGRAKRLAELMRTLWTGRNARGQLQFKSTYFTVSGISDDPQQACDTLYHPRAVQPALLLWLRTGDPDLGALFSDWMNTWVEASARAERGKPAGVIPAAIHWPEGHIGGAGPDWWDPRNHSEASLYAWPSPAMGMMCDTLLLTHHMTKDARYLAPIRALAALSLKHLAASGEAGDPAPGSEAWCARQLGSRLAGTLAKYRRLTGDTRFDAVLTHDLPSALTVFDEPDRAKLVAALRNTAEALRVNFEGYTREVRYTDRVLKFPELFRMKGMINTAGIKTPDPVLLYSLATGDPGDMGYFPLNRVRWLTPPRDLAALVTRAEPGCFEAELYHFGADQRPMAAELYGLNPGVYRLTVSHAAKPLGPSTPVTVNGPRARIVFRLPPRLLCTVRVVQELFARR